MLARIPAMGGAREASSFETLAPRAPQDEVENFSTLMVRSAALPRVSNHEADV
jgi:hypothetical protein